MPQLRRRMQNNEGRNRKKRLTARRETEETPRCVYCPSSWEEAARLQVMWGQQNSEKQRDDKTPLAAIIYLFLQRSKHSREEEGLEETRHSLQTAHQASLCFLEFFFLEYHAHSQPSMNRTDTRHRVAFELKFQAVSQTHWPKAAGNNRDDFRRLQKQWIFKSLADLVEESDSIFSWRLNIAARMATFHRLTSGTRLWTFFKRIIFSLKQDNTKALQPTSAETAATL